MRSSELERRCGDFNTRVRHLLGIEAPSHFLLLTHARFMHRIVGTHAYFEYADDPSFSYLDSAYGNGNAVVSYDRLGA